MCNDAKVSMKIHEHMYYWHLIDLIKLIGTMLLFTHILITAKTVNH